MLSQLIPFVITSIGVFYVQQEIEKKVRILVLSIILFNILSFIIYDFLGLSTLLLSYVVIIIFIIYEDDKDMSVFLFLCILFYYLFYYFGIWGPTSFVIFVIFCYCCTNQAT